MAPLIPNQTAPGMQLDPAPLLQLRNRDQKLELAAHPCAMDNQSCIQNWLQPTHLSRKKAGKAVCKASSFLCTWFLGVNGYDVHTLSLSERTLWTGRPAAWTSASVDEAHPASFKKILT